MPFLSSERKFQDCGEIVWLEICFRISLCEALPPCPAPSPHPKWPIFFFLVETWVPIWPQPGSCLQGLRLILQVMALLWNLAFPCLSLPTAKLVSFLLALSYKSSFLLQGYTCFHLALGEISTERTAARFWPLLLVERWNLGGLRSLTDPVQIPALLMISRVPPRNLFILPEPPFLLYNYLSHSIAVGITWEGVSETRSSQQAL